MADGAHIIDAGEQADFNRTTREIKNAPRGQPLVVQANRGFFDELERHLTGVMGSLPHNIRNAIDRARRGEALSGVVQDAFTTAAAAATGDTAAVETIARAAGQDSQTAGLAERTAAEEAKQQKHQEKQWQAEVRAAEMRVETLMGREWLNRFRTGLPDNATPEQRRVFTNDLARDMIRIRTGEEPSEQQLDGLRETVVQRASDNNVPPDTLTDSEKALYMAILREHPEIIDSSEFWDAVRSRNPQRIAYTIKALGGNDDAVKKAALLNTQNNEAQALRQRLEESIRTGEMSSEQAEQHFREYFDYQGGSRQAIVNEAVQEVRHFADEGKATWRDAMKKAHTMIQKNHIHGLPQDAQATLARFLQNRPPGVSDEAIVSALKNSNFRTGGEQDAIDVNQTLQNLRQTSKGAANAPSAQPTPQNQNNGTATNQPPAPPPTQQNQNNPASGGQWNNAAEPGNNTPQPGANENNQTGNNYNDEIERRFQELVARSNARQGGMG